MNGTLPEFDDPHLKASVRRALDVGAGPELRARVAALVAQETRPVAHPLTYPWRRRLTWVAAAAAILSVASVVGVRIWHERHEAEERAEYLAANLPLFNEMIGAHARSGAGAGGAAVFPVGDRDGLRKTLAAKLGRAIPVPDWGAKGWRLTRAEVAPIGSHSAAELRYENAGRAILLVSLPAGAYSGHEGEEPEPYQYTVDRHPIAGFVKDGGLHCAIGDPGVTPRELGELKIE